MELPPDQLQELKSTFPGIATAEEGSVPFVLFPELLLPSGSLPERVRALLCPTQRDGYPSRLFLAQKVQHKGTGHNWNADGVVILGQRWWAVSWMVSDGQRLINMIATTFRHSERETGIKGSL
jgi:hypothetical protein